MAKSVNKQRLTGDILLSSLRKFPVRLENGETVSFSIKREVCLPKNPAELEEAARRLPARLAFWSYQRARAEKAVRKMEARVARREAEMYHAYRKHYIDDTEESGYPTDGRIKASVEVSDEVIAVRKLLSERLYELAIIRAIVLAVEHASNTARKLVDVESTEYRRS